MKIIKNILLNGSAGKPIALDIFFEENGRPKPVIIYAHGFNGFKDWGGTDQIATRFAGLGFVFIKFNFSHNGTRPETPETFTDPEAYSQNTYSRELHDLRAVIDWSLSSQNGFADVIDKERTGLIGHSRGGGIVLLHAATDPRVSAVCTWASVAECKTPWGNWPEEKMLAWKETGVQYTTNSRTRQEMPLRYSLYEDYIKNETALNIERAVRSLQVPLLICHGRADTSVPIEAAYSLKNWKEDAAIFLPDSDHVFGRKHPWEDETLPEATLRVIEESVAFFRVMQH